MATQPESFGTLLRRFRVARGWTQEELAERAAVSPRAIVNWENGTTLRPQREPVRLLVAALNLSTEDRTLLEVALTAPRTTVLAPQAPAAAPPAAPLYLPTPLTPLLGRESELASLVALLTRGATRLVTVLGPGGVGKTRLALAAAAVAAVRDAYPAGVHFVSLAAVREPEVLWLATAQVLGIKPTGTQTPYDALRTWLRERRALLVLDNFEHLLSEAVVVANLLIACPGLTVLATSRAPLRVRGEQEYPLAPLAVPDASAPASAIAASPTAQVFTYYAHAVRPEFRLTAENAATVAAICAYLEGLPLALELAAARIRRFTPAQLLERLTPRLSALVDGPRDLAPRQQTMRGAIAWSDGLLAAAERRVFARFAVFVGGATPDAVEAVCGAGAEAHAASLVLQSLLTAAPGTDGAMRYDMLETVREYAAEQLAASGEAEDAQRQHAAWYAALAGAAYAELRGGEQGAWLDRLEADHNNVRAALRRLRDRGDAERELHAVAGMVWFWAVRGFVDEGEAWVVGLLARVDNEATAGRVYRQVMFGAGWLALVRGDLDTAQARFHDLLNRSRAAEDARFTAVALVQLGHVARNWGDYAAARGYYMESLPFREAISDTQGMAISLSGMGRADFALGDLDSAASLLRRALALCAEAGDAGEEARIRLHLGHVVLRQGEGDEARRLFAASLRTHHALADRAGIASTFEALATLAAWHEAYAHALRFTGAARAARADVGIPMLRLEEAQHEREVLAPARVALGEAGSDAALAAGESLPLDAAVTMARGFLAHVEEGHDTVESTRHP